MKKFIIILVLAGTSLILPTSCLKQYLDKAPQQGLTADQIFTKLDNFKLYFDAVYAGTKYVGTAWDDYNIKTAFPLYFGVWDQKYTYEDVTDAADAGRYMEGQAWKSGNMSETIVNKLTYDAVRRPILESMFTDIRISNTALRNVKRIADADDAAKNDLAGQAYFIRAFCHMTLMNLWGPMPYLDKVLGPTDQWDIPRLSKHECLTRIAQDFDSAYYFFNLAGKVRRDPPLGVPGHLDYNAYQMYRPNGMAALAYKSRALLFRASPLNTDGSATDWSEAAKASWDALQVALNNGVFLLTLPNRKTNFYGSMVSDESIWTYSFGTLTWSGGWPSTITNCGMQALYNGVFGASTGSNSGVCPTQNFVDKYETLNGEPLNTQADRDAATAAGHYNDQDAYTNRDPRLATDIITNQSPCIGYTAGKAQIYYSVAAGKVTYSELLDQAYLGITKTGYYMRKFWFDNSTKNQVSSILTDPLFRLAELYLNYAEASNEAYGPTAIGVSGATLSAVAAINVVRTRAGMPNVLGAYTGSAAAFRPRIKNERNVELSWEGHYYNDIHRWMDLQTIMTSTLIGMDIEKIAATGTYAQMFRSTRKPLTQDRQVVWKPQMYYLPFNNADNLKMKNFVPNPVW
jgi:starch-binding outer membrane protein, SusD/RagB family